MGGALCFYPDGLRNWLRRKNENRKPGEPRITLMRLACEMKLRPTVWSAIMNGHILPDTWTIGKIQVCLHKYGCTSWALMSEKRCRELEAADYREGLRRCSAPYQALEEPGEKHVE